ncbi:MAG: glutamate dehydrogenase, partial [Phycisphaerae bacterium]
NGRSALEVDCDILLLAALEGQITSENASRIRAPLIAEAANGPITFEADEYLRSHGKVVIPDVYLNAGGVTVSYFEWIKNISHVRFGRLENRLEQGRGKAIVAAIEGVLERKVPDELAMRITGGASELDLVRSGLDDTMCRAYREIRDVYRSREPVTDLRAAAYVVSLEKIALAYVEMGI